MLAKKYYAYIIFSIFVTKNLYKYNIKKFVYNVIMENKNNSKNMRIGEILLNSNDISMIELSMALDIQRFQQRPLGEIIIDLRAIDNNKLYSALKIQGKI